MLAQETAPIHRQAANQKTVGELPPYPPTHHPPTHQPNGLTRVAEVGERCRGRMMPTGNNERNFDDTFGEMRNLCGSYAVISKAKKKTSNILRRG